ncbi:MAG: hypothetical protein KJN90_12965 [Gammaproteobacteria bacterium]|nr:hypothetical protein [Gammaproteobacteria bacterium]
MATFSNWFRNEILGIIEGDTPVIPTQLYVAVHSTVCSSATPGTELSGDGYARVPITFERVSDIQRWNPADVTTPAASAEWPTVASFSLWDSASIGGGNYYAYGNLTTAISVDAQKAIKWPANKVIVGLGSPVT